MLHPLRPHLHTRWLRALLILLCLRRLIRLGTADYIYPVLGVHLEDFLWKMAIIYPFRIQSLKVCDYFGDKVINYLIEFSDYRIAV